MANIAPFKAFRPADGYAELVAALPYDVLDIQQAKSAAGSNPYSFLHVDKAGIDLNNIKDIYSPEVYQKAADCLNGMIEKGILIQDNMPCLYIYRLTDGRHIQTGLVACANIEDYINGSIKKHEGCSAGEDC